MSTHERPHDYFERKRIPQILESITTGLVYGRPEDPLDYIEACVRKLRASQGGKPVPWDTFIPLPDREAQTQRALAPQRAKQPVYQLNPGAKAPEPRVLPSLATTSTTADAATLNKLPVLPAIGSSSSISTNVQAPVTTLNKAWSNIIFVLGGPGSGKGTQCERLARDYHFAHLSAGDLLRAEVATGSELGRQCEELMKEGKIVPLEVTTRLLRQAMDQAPEDAEGFLIDGFPRQLDQAEYFEQQVAPSRMVLWFDCPETLLERRLLKRGETSGRADDNLATIKKRFRTFVDTSMPVIEHYRKEGKCHRISSEPAVDEVYRRVQLLLTPHLPLNHPNVVFVLGGPGSGKGTQCERLAREFSLTHISTGDLLRAEVERGSAVGREATELMREGKMVPMPLILGLVRACMIEHLDAPGFLLDGYPREVEQAVEFERTIGPCRQVIYFNCPLEVLERRLLERGKTSGRADDNLDSIKKRFITYQKASLPVIEYFRSHGPQGRVVEIASDQGIDAVYSQARQVFATPLPFGGERIIFVLGGPGSGKGTQCAEIVSNLHYAHLSTGDLLREEVKRGTDLGRQCEELMREGKMVPMEVTMQLLRAAMEQARGAPGFLIDGFPRTLEQADVFESTIGKCTFVLYFECSDEVLTQRLLKRGETSGRADDNLESIQKRLVTFANTSMPVIGRFTGDGRVRKVNSEGPVGEITSQTLACFADLA